MKSQTTLPHVTFITESSSLSHLLAFCCFQHLKNDSLLLNSLPSVALHLGSWTVTQDYVSAWLGQQVPLIIWPNIIPIRDLVWISLASVFLVTWLFWGSLVRCFTGMSLQFDLGLCDGFPHRINIFYKRWILSGRSAIHNTSHQGIRADDASSGHPAKGVCAGLSL